MLLTVFAYFELLFLFAALGSKDNVKLYIRNPRLAVLLFCLFMSSMQFHSFLPFASHMGGLSARGPYID
jgi:hypothetical protein